MISQYYPVGFGYIILLLNDEDSIDSQEPGRPIGDGENQHPGPSPERLGRVVG